MIRLLRRALLLLAAAMLTVTASAVPSSAAKSFEFGAFPGPRAGQTKIQALNALEADLGRQLDAVRIFKKWDDDLTWYDREVASRGKTLVFSVSSSLRGGGHVAWADIAASQPGEPIFKNMVRWAKALDTLDTKVVLIFNHEPEGDYNMVKGTASEYKQAYGRWVQVMRQHGGPDLEFATSSTSWAFRVDPSDRRHPSKWIPSPIYVDHLGLQAYNFHDCRPGGDRWVEAATIVEPFREWAQANYPGKGLWLTEVGTVEGDTWDAKRNWVSDLDALLRTDRWSSLEGMTWYHTDEQSDGRTDRDCDWWMNSSNASLNTFTTMANSWPWR